MRTSPEEKSILNPEETILLYGLSRRKFQRLISGKRRLNFVVRYNTRKLIIREEFEKYLDEEPTRREELKNGDPVIKKTGQQEAHPA